MQAPRQRGFNLVETAIVLGLVGLVIGAIWIAASALSESYKASETQKGLMVLASNLQRNLPYASYPSTGGLALQGAPVVAMKAGPDNWIRGTEYYTPYNTQITFMLYASDTLPSGSVPRVPHFRITFTTPTKAQANSLIRLLANRASQFGLTYAYCGPAGTSTIEWGANIPFSGFPTCSTDTNGVTIRLFFAAGTAH